MINVAALEEIYLNIDKAKAAQKRNDQPKIIAVTKTHPFSAIEDVYNCGIFSIGENRVQEASNKFQSFNKMPNLTKRFIGHLQSNKVKKCMELFDTISISNPRFIAAVISILVLLGLLFFLYKTWTGKALRAVSQDREAAAIAGINPHRMNMLAFAMGG